MQNDLLFCKINLVDSPCVDNLFLFFFKFAHALNKLEKQTIINQNPVVSSLLFSIVMVNTKRKKAVG